MHEFDRTFRLFFESLSESHFNLKCDFSFIDFYEESVKFNSGEMFTEEAHLFLDVPNESIDFTLKNSNRLIIGNDFKNTFKTSRHWRNLKNVDFKRQYFAIFDFSSEHDIMSFFHGCFNLSDELELTKKINEFKNYVDKDLSGFYNELNGTFIFCINLKRSNIVQTIYHELSHFIQINGSIRITKSFIKEPTNELIDILGNDFNKIIEYFSGEEFSVHLDDLLLDIRKFKNEFHKDERDILNLIMTELMKIHSREDLDSNEMVKRFSIANDGDYGNLMFLFVSYKMRLKFQLIVNFLKNNLF